MSIIYDAGQFQDDYWRYLILAMYSLWLSDFCSTSCTGCAGSSLGLTVITLYKSLLESFEMCDSIQFSCNVNCKRPFGIHVGPETSLLVGCSRLN